MLRPDILFRCRALWEKRLGPGVNRAEYAAPVEIRCHAEIERGCDGLTGRIFLPAGLAVSPGDKLTAEGAACFVKAVRFFPTHGECEIA